MSSSHKFSLVILLLSLILSLFCSPISTYTASSPLCNPSASFSYLGNYYISFFYYGGNGSFTYRGINSTFNYYGTNSSFSYSNRGLPQLSFTFNGLNSSISSTDFNSTIPHYPLNYTITHKALNSTYLYYSNNCTFTYRDLYSNFTFSRPNASSLHYASPNFNLPHCAFNNTFTYANIYESFTFYGHNSSLNFYGPNPSLHYNGPPSSFVDLHQPPLPIIPKCGLNASYKQFNPRCYLNCDNIHRKRRLCLLTWKSECACHSGYIFRSGEKGDCITPSQCQNLK